MIIEHIKELFKLERHLLGEGYDKALQYIHGFVPLDIINVPSGTQFETWEVPQEWIVKEAWVKFNGEKIIDYQKNPLSLMVGSMPFKGTVNRDELKAHLYWSDDRPKAFSYVTQLYGHTKDSWGFSLPKERITRKATKEECEGGVCYPEFGVKAVVEGQEDKAQYIDLLPEGEYEVFIDAEFKPGVMKIGVHTIPGKSDREILLFAHLDHAWQANDNLSAVAALMDMAEELKARGYEHTIKLVFCPETIGSIAYAFGQDISKVDFMMALDIVGNDHTLLIQKAFDRFNRLNYVVHLALQDEAISSRKGEFRYELGSDEYVFNDPLIGIPGVFISRNPYPEYHTSEDTPDIIKEEKVKETQSFILKTIDIYEKDFIPERKFKGPLRRSKYDLQTPYQMINRGLDYLVYDIDGKKYLSEILLPLEIGFDWGYKFISKLEENNEIIRVNTGKGPVKKTRGKK